MSIIVYTKIVLQLQQHHWNSLHMESSIFVLWFMVKLSGKNSVTNNVNWLKLLIQFLRLNILNINVSVLKGYCIHKDWNIIWSQLELTNR